MASQRRMRGQRGVSLFVGIASLLVIIPMLGLMIDVAVLYNVKGRLQAAVDGASLAAARALVLGTTTSAQATSAKQNAVNWFYANFPAGNWASTGTVMDQTTVTVADDATNPHLRNVTVTASTNAPTYFMKWLNFGAVTVSASGNASRRDVVMMMVLDRSYSMQLASACGDLITAAKVFTGQFAAGRDRIGMVSFATDVVVHSQPTTNFQTTLGYSNSSGSGTGAIDTITCNGNTNTAQALSIAYNELWKMNMPGAMNVIMLETDGLPNTLTVNFWDSVHTVAGISSSSGCTDTANKTKSASGFGSAAVLPNWSNRVPLCGLGGGTCGSNNSYLPGNPTQTPAGIVGAVGTTDPGDPGTPPNYFLVMQQPYNGNSQGGFNFINASGSCAFNSNNTPTTAPSDLAWLPTTDVYGNQLNPSNAFLGVSLSGGYVQNSGWTNMHNAAQNAADNAAYQMRNGFNLPSPNNSTLLQPYIFVLGLGGSPGTPPDYVLMQRIANDPNGDNYNIPAKYSACGLEANCVNYPSQPQGTFIFSINKQQLSQAFLQISSQILRLSK